VCLACWRRYVNAKMDGEGLIFGHLADGSGTVRCPSTDGCDAYATSAHLFLILKGRDKQYRDLCDARIDTEDTKLARLPLKEKISDTKPCPLVNPYHSASHHSHFSVVNPHMYIVIVWYIIPSCRCK
jgi:hypothetical protein